MILRPETPPGYLYIYKDHTTSGSQEGQPPTYPATSYLITLDATKVEISTEAAREQHNGAVLARAHAWPQAGPPSSGWVANQATLGVTQV